MEANMLYYYNHEHGGRHGLMRQPAPHQKNGLHTAARLYRGLTRLLERHPALYWFSVLVAMPVCLVAGVTLVALLGAIPSLLF